MSDDWFSHQGESAPQSEHASHISPRALGVTFLIIVFGVLFVVLVLVAYFNAYNGATLAQKREGIEFVAQDYLDYKSISRQTLSRTAWVNREEGVVRVPIERTRCSICTAVRSGRVCRSGTA